MILSYNRYHDKIQGTKDQQKILKQKAMFTTAHGYLLYPETETLDNLMIFLQDKVVYSGIHFINNNRNTDNSILIADMFIFDIDDGLSLKELKELKLPFLYSVLTTVSFTKDHNKYRLFVPIPKTKFSSSEEFKFYMTAFASHYKLPVDKSCLEVARSYITHEDAKYRIIDGKEASLEPVQYLVDQYKKEMKRLKIQEKLREAAIAACDVRYKRSPITLNQVLSFPRTKEILRDFYPGNNDVNMYILISTLIYFSIDDMLIISYIKSLGIKGHNSDSYIRNKIKYAKRNKTKE